MLDFIIKIVSVSRPIKQLINSRVQCIYKWRELTITRITPIWHTDDEQCVTHIKSNSHEISHSLTHTHAHTHTRQITINKLHSIWLWILWFSCCCFVLFWVRFVYFFLLHFLCIWVVRLVKLFDSLVDTIGDDPQHTYTCYCCMNGTKYPRSIVPSFVHYEIQYSMLAARKPHSVQHTQSNWKFSKSNEEIKQKLKLFSVAFVDVSLFYLFRLFYLVFLFRWQEISQHEPIFGIRMWIALEHSHSHICD